MSRFNGSNRTVSVSSSFALGVESSLPQLPKKLGRSAIAPVIKTKIAMETEIAMATETVTAIKIDLETKTARVMATVT